MKIERTRLLALSLFLPVLGVAQQVVQQPAGQFAQVEVSSTTNASMTPAEQKIEVAKKQIDRDPKKVQSYNELALACLKRARESSDPRFLDDADGVLTEGLAIDASDFQLHKTQVAILLGRHRWIEARKLAADLNKRIPDDVATYGYMAEADFELGNYAAAETSAQWMLNMLRNNVPGLVMGARLRNVYGDADGAIELLRMAYGETSPFEVEDLAWLANQIAVLQLESGKLEAANQTLDGARQLFANYVPTLKNLARVRIEQGRAKEAVELLTTARKQENDAHTVYLLATALKADGHPVEAANTLDEFQKMLSNSDLQSGEGKTDEAQLDMIWMTVDHPATAGYALTLAQQRVGLRHDVWTLDADAWVLQANGKSAEADLAIQKAIAVGVQSAQIFDHAGHIARSLNHVEEAGKYFGLAMRADAASDYASDARRTLGLQTDDQNGLGPRLNSKGPAPVAPLHGFEVATAAQTVAIEIPILDRGLPAFSSVPLSLMVPRPTDTDRMIHQAQALAVRNPKDAKSYSALGAAHFQRARETGDVSDYQQAEESLYKSLDLVSTDFTADEPLGTMAEVCMGEHRFAEALTYSQKALSLGSGDVSSFAIVGDAYADMGEYEKSAQAYARLTPRDMTLSPRAAYARDSRLAYLKFVNGDTAGAVALMKTAAGEGVEARLPNENLAWLYYELGEFYVQSGDAASADAAYLEALSVHPGDYRALASLAKLRSNTGKIAEAIVLYQHAIAVVPMPIFIAELGDLYAKTGKPEEAKKQYQLVEYIGLLGHINQVLHNRDLALFYADHDIKLAEALELARKEFEVRHDVYTWDALAWALFKNGQYAEAAKASKSALQFGTKDPLLLFHAGVIADQAGRHDEARIDLSQALQINPHFHLLYADVAQQKLARMSAQVASKETDAH